MVVGVVAACCAPGPANEVELDDTPGLLTASEDEGHDSLDDGHYNHTGKHKQCECVLCKHVDICKCVFYKHVNM